MRLSIITINRNNARGLQTTIDSVAEQTWHDFQYIVVDGASQDGSKSVIEERQHDIDSWISEADHGIYDAQNKGIAMAKGEYCLFLNSGDYLSSPRTLAAVFDHELKEDIVYGNLAFSSANGKPKCMTFPAVLEFDYFFSGSLPHPASFIRRDALNAAGGYRTDFRYVSDWIFFMDSIFKRNCTYAHIEKVVAHFDTSGVTSDARYTAAVREERERHLRSEYSNLCRGLENQDAYIAIRYSKKHRESKALRYLFSVISATSDFLRMLKKRIT